jgi:hypothetical protein
VRFGARVALLGVSLTAGVILCTTRDKVPVQWGLLNQRSFDLGMGARSSTCLHCGLVICGMHLPSVGLCVTWMGPQISKLDHEIVGKMQCIYILCCIDLTRGP